MLDTPFVLRSGLRLGNRIVKASMTERLAAVDGCPTPELVRLYENFAAGGAALLLTGNVVVDPAHLEGYGNAVLDRDTHLAAFARWAAAGKAHATPLIVQLNHPGRQAPRTLLQRPVAPSEVGLARYGYFARPRALGDADIEAIIAQFVESARLAEAAGFAGAQVHAAHGYLLSQFLAPNVNRRNDAWGGSLANRARLLLRIVDGIRERVSTHFTVGVKLNAGDFVKGGFLPDEAVQVMRWLDQRAVDFIEISGGTFERPASFGRGMKESSKRREAYFLELAREARTATSIPLIVTGGFRSREAMQAALESGACDLIGMARPLAVEPDLPRRLLSGAASAALGVELNAPRGPVGDLAELYWYRDQLARIARGLAPRSQGFSLLSLARELLRDAFRAFSHLRQTQLPCRPALPQGGDA